ncbi:MAG: hypothetical protein ACK40G_03455 [Cytophagaceae bacterium]
MRFSFFYIFPLSLLILASCTEENSSELSHTTDTTSFSRKDTITVTKPETKKVEEEEDVVLELKRQDKKYLMLIEDIPLGSNYKYIKEKFPKLKAPRPEGGSEQLGAQGYSDATSEIRLMNYSGTIEFNFKNDSLYSYFFTLNENDYDKGMNLYYGLQTFYNEKWGACIEENVEEMHKYSRSCYWNPENFSTVMSYNINSGMLSWGFQRHAE